MSDTLSVLLLLASMLGIGFALVFLLLGLFVKKYRGGMKKSAIALLICVVVFFVSGAMLGTEAEDTEVVNENVDKEIEIEAEAAEDLKDSVSEPETEAAEVSEESTPKQKTEVEERVEEPGSQEEVSSETIGQKNACEKAESYLSFMAFSYEGLINQLEFEGYTHEEAVYGADNCGADWNEQALKSAKSYLNTFAFSYQGLVNQLEFDKYTNEQATYGADNCGADWNEQAAKSAASYLELMSFSREGLIEQLEFDGFTSEQAVYGVTANGY